MPSVWVAPTHSFDRTTIAALYNETPVRIVSDGIARNEFERDGFRWIPQQLWSLTTKEKGLWTVCLHPNSLTDGDFAKLEAQLKGSFAGKVVALDDLEPQRRARAVSDYAEAAHFWYRHHMLKTRARVKKLVIR